MLTVEQEIVRTLPPDEPCGNCGSMCDECADFPDNRMELYKHFAFVPSDIKGEYLIVCKRCLKSCFVREGLYRITSHEGRSRPAWVVEKVVCHSCGNRWKREEKGDGT